MARPGLFSQVCAATVAGAMALGLAACGGKAKTANSTTASSSSAASSAGAASSASATATGPATAYVYYYQGMPTHVAELAQLGTDLLPQAFASAKMSVHVTAIPTTNVVQTLNNLVGAHIGNNTIIVCACPSLPTALLSTKTEGYPFVQTKQPSANFYYSELGSMTAAMVANPFWAALGAIQKQVPGLGQSKVSAFLTKNFGDDPGRAVETYDALSGQPVHANVTDLHVQEIDFYPFPGWNPATEYVTQVVSVENLTENSLTSLSFPLLPGARDVHQGFWGNTTPPFTGKPVTPGAGDQVTLPAPIKPFTAANLAVTYSVGDPTGKQWQSFSWSLPFATKNLEVKLFKYYAAEGDSVKTTLPQLKGDATFDIWGEQNVSAGQTISFQPLVPDHTPIIPKAAASVLGGAVVGAG